MIDTDGKLAEALPEFRKTPWIALDTEADSLHAYPEKLCLVQLGLPGREFLVDPLASLQLGPLWKVLQGHELILHGADYDLRLLRKAAQFVPNAIFDTMLAARLLGCDQFGLTDLVFRFLGVRLEKGPQKANWAKRPLTPRMETYALNDVRYLPQLATHLRGELKELDRVSWHREWCRRLITDCNVSRAVDPDQVWRIKGSHKLTPPALAVLKEVYYWREEEAVRVNKPPFFILTPTAMVNLATAAVNGTALKTHLPPRFSARRQAGLKEAVERGLANRCPPQTLQRASRRPADLERKRYRELEHRRDQKAKQLGIDPTVIASRGTLMGLARDGEPYRSDLMSWQRALLFP